MKLANTLFLALAGVKAEPEGDVEHRKNIQSIVIDQNWKDFDERAELLFAELFPGVVTDPDFLANVSRLFIFINFSKFILFYLGTND